MNTFLICFINGLFKEYRWLQEEYNKTDIQGVIDQLEKDLVGLAPVKARIKEIQFLGDKKMNLRSVKVKLEGKNLTECYVLRKN